MKRFLTLTFVALLAIVVANARTRTSRNIADLPVAAQQTIEKYFGKNINHIKIDKKTFGGWEYDVILDNGTELEFDNDGQIKEIDCGHRQIPKELILKPIRDYVSKNFSGRKIVKLEIKSNKYEIGLNDGTDLEFDRSGTFIRIDQ